VWTLFIETFISVKFLKDAGNIQYVETPIYIWLPWVITMIGSTVWWLHLRTRS
jgi:phosphatidylserine synthase 2